MTLPQSLWRALRTVVVPLLIASAGTTPAFAQHAAVQSSRWYGAEPHVPMAIVTQASNGQSRRIEPVSWVGAVSPRAASVIAAGQRAACTNWSRVGVGWNAVDRWGQLLGTRRLTARDFYEVTGCYEATFPDDPTASAQPWQAGRSVLYESGTWRARPSMQWVPSDAVRHEHERFLATLTSLVLAPSTVRAASASPTPDGEPSMPPLVDRTMFFHVADPGDPDNSIRPSDRQFAVSGGRALVIAERANDGHWFAAYLENSLGIQRWSNNLAYVPIAVFDMNEDGWPEIVCHEREGGGEFYGDIVISHDTNGTWVLVARSVGGSTA